MDPRKGGFLRMKARIIAAAAAFAVVLGLAFAGYAVLNMPEIALQRMADEVRRDGPEALEAHLTSRALFKYKLALKAYDLPLTRKAAGLVSAGEQAEVFSCRLDHMERTGDRAEAFMKVSCAGLTGVVRVDMIRTAGVWMINDLKLDLRGTAPRMGGDGYAQA